MKTQKNQLPFTKGTTMNSLLQKYKSNITMKIKPNIEKKVQAIPQKQALPKKISKETVALNSAKQSNEKVKASKQPTNSPQNSPKPNQNSPKPPNPLEIRNKSFDQTTKQQKSMLEHLLKLLETQEKSKTKKSTINLKQILTKKNQTVTTCSSNSTTSIISKSMHKTEKNEKKLENHEKTREEFEKIEKKEAQNIKKNNAKIQNNPLQSIIEKKKDPPAKKTENQKPIYEKASERGEQCKTAKLENKKSERSGAKVPEIIENIAIHFKKGEKKSEKVEKNIEKISKLLDNKQEKSMANIYAKINLFDNSAKSIENKSKREENPIKILQKNTEHFKKNTKPPLSAKGTASTKPTIIAKPKNNSKKINDYYNSGNQAIKNMSNPMLSLKRGTYDQIFTKKNCFFKENRGNSINEIKAKQAKIIKKPEVNNYVLGNKKIEDTNNLAKIVKICKDVLSNSKGQLQTKACKDEFPSAKNIANQAEQDLQKRRENIVTLKRSPKIKPPPNISKSFGSPLSGVSQILHDLNSITKKNKDCVDRELKRFSSLNLNKNQCDPLFDNIEVEEFSKEILLAKKELLVSKIKQLIDFRIPIKTSLEFYQFVSFLGMGSYGKVQKAISILTSRPVAIKCIEKSLLSDDIAKRKLFNEIAILRNLCHPNVIKLLEVFSNKTHIFLVTEYAMLGDLFEIIKKHKLIPESDAKFLFKQIVDGLKYLHDRNIVHRDIKPDNILLNKNMEVKICDFGVSRMINKRQILKEQCGTPAQIAPEILNNNGQHGCYSDLWSLGVLLYVMVTGKIPFKADKISELKRIITQCIYDLPKSLSADCRDLITKLLDKNPERRLSPTEILQHKWLLNNPTEIRRESLNVVPIHRHDSKVLTASALSMEIEWKKVLDVIKLGFKKESLLHDLLNNSLTHSTACYYLLKNYEP